MSTLNWKDSMFYGYTLTTEQEDYLESIFTNRLTISNSVSGSGKTTIPVLAAHYMKYDILYIFFPVQEQTSGYRPGTQSEKDKAYIGPLEDAILELGLNPFQTIRLSGDDNVNQKKSNNGWRVTAVSHIFLRGRNLGKDGKLLVIIDEAQNGTRPELRKILSRIHDNAKVVLIGHTGQCDLPIQSFSGFERAIEVYKDKRYSKVCNLTKNFRGELSSDAEDI